MIQFPTWQGLVNNVIKESISDHISLKNPLIVNQIFSITPLIGDHVLIMTDVKGVLALPKILMKRNWRNYDKTLLLEKFLQVDFEMIPDESQSMWNHLEQKIVLIIDEIVPYAEFLNKTTVKSKYSTI